MSPTIRVDTRVTVETPEGVDFRFVIAGPGKRAISYLLDTILKIAVIAVTFILVFVVSGVTNEEPTVGIGFGLLIWFAMSWLYGACFETFWNGQTPGKRSQNLRVVRTNGTPVAWFEAFGRNLLMVADNMPVLVFLPLNTAALVSMAFTSRMQRLGDLVFDTMVIDESREYISRNPDATAGVKRLRRSECRHRFHVPERTLAVIERLFEGDRIISDGRREEISRPLSVALQQRLGWQPPQPDPLNPNTYFAASPFRHTQFLKQVLRTFADEVPESEEEEAAEMTSGQPGD